MINTEITTKITELKPHKINPNNKIYKKVLTQQKRV